MEKWRSWAQSSPGPGPASPAGAVEGRPRAAETAAPPLLLPALPASGAPRGEGLLLPGLWLRPAAWAVRAAVGECAVDVGLASADVPAPSSPAAYGKAVLTFNEYMSRLKNKRRRNLSE